MRIICGIHKPRDLVTPATFGQEKRKVHFCLSTYFAIYVDCLNGKLFMHA